MERSPGSSHVISIGRIRWPNSGSMEHLARMRCGFSTVAPGCKHSASKGIIRVAALPIGVNLADR